MPLLQRPPNPPFVIPTLQSLTPQDGVRAIFVIIQSSNPHLFHSAQATSMFCWLNSRSAIFRVSILSCGACIRKRNLRPLSSGMSLNGATSASDPASSLGLLRVFLEDSAGQLSVGAAEGEVPEPGVCWSSLLTSVSALGTLRFAGLARRTLRAAETLGDPEPGML